jgi:hypothetical protein
MFFIFSLFEVFFAAALQKSTELQLASSLLDGKDIHFKAIPTISVDLGGNIWAIDNRDSVGYFFDVAGNTAIRVGRLGQGPGELQFPSFICSDSLRVYIRDQIGLSIFDKKGKFINRIKLMNSTISIAAHQEKLYIAQTGFPDLITVYDLQGNKISSFGQKYTVDYSLYKGTSTNLWSTDLTDRVINSGKIFFSKECIYFVSTIFGDVFKYDFSGQFLSKSKLFDGDIVNKTEYHYFKEGRTVDKSPYRYGIYYDVAFDGDYFYGLMKRKFFQECPGDVIKIEEKTMSITESYVFSESDGAGSKKSSFSDLGILRSSDNRTQLVVSLYDDQTGDNRINIYEPKKIPLLDPTKTTDPARKPPTAKSSPAS